MLGIQSVRWIDELMNRWSNECVGWFNFYLLLVLQNVLHIYVARTFLITTPCTATPETLVFLSRYLVSGLERSSHIRKGAKHFCKTALLDPVLSNFLSRLLSLELTLVLQSRTFLLFRLKSPHFRASLGKWTSIREYVVQAIRNFGCSDSHIIIKTLLFLTKLPVAN